MPKPPEPYVYTLAAVRGRLRRGAPSVLLCWPYRGTLVRCTKANLAAITKQWRGEGWKT